MKIIPSSVTLIAMTPDPLRLIEQCGRVCYRSEGDTGARFVRMLIDRGHESVLEHASMTVMIVCDRGISHEIVRHRIGCSYSQESTRYCAYDELSYILPLDLVANDYDTFIEYLEESERFYRAMLKGYSPQVARDALPTCVATRICMTANFRAWRHFLRLRMAEGAHPKIRTIAWDIADIFIGAGCSCIVEDLEGKI